MRSELRLDPDLAPLFDSPAVDSATPRASPPASRRATASAAGARARAPTLRCRPGRARQGRLRALPAAAGGRDLRARQVPGRLQNNVRRCHRFARPGLCWVYGDGADGGTARPRASRIFAAGQLEGHADRHRPRLQLPERGDEELHGHGRDRPGRLQLTRPRRRSRRSSSRSRRSSASRPPRCVSRSRRRRPSRVTVGRVKGKKLVGSREASPSRAPEGRQQRQADRQAPQAGARPLRAQGRREGRGRELREVGLAQAVGSLSGCDVSASRARRASPAPASR